MEDSGEEYSKSRYVLRRAINRAKRQYRDRVESNFQGSNLRHMWTRIRTITDCKRTTSVTEEVSPSLPNDLKGPMACYFMDAYI